MGPLHGVVFQNRLPQPQSPIGSQVLPVNLFQHGLLSPTKSLLQHRLSTGPQHPLASTCSSTVDCSWVSVPAWTSECCGVTTCLTKVFTRGCRGISPLAHEAPPAYPSAWTSVTAALFVSHILIPLLCFSYTGHFFSLLLTVLSQRCSHRHYCPQQ